MSIFTVTTSTYVTTRSQKLTPHHRGEIAKARHMGVHPSIIATIFGIHPRTVDKIAKGSWENGGVIRGQYAPGRVVGVSE